MLALLIGFEAGALEDGRGDAVDQYQLQLGVKIPVRDGVNLNATLYRPLHAAGPLPVILLLTPYPDNTDHPSGSYFARRGYIFAYVDVRGRGDSEGKFNPMAQEAQDGHDVVEWLARQSWSNGQVAMWGGSYPAELDGRIGLHLWLEVGAPDADLGYALYLITPDGKAHWLTSDRLRARYRHGLDRAEAIAPGKPEEYVLPAGRWLAQRIPKGSYLRLILEAVNVPEMQKNWNSMKPVSEQTGADGRVATIRVLHDSSHPSRLILPLGEPAAPCAGG